MFTCGKYGTVNPYYRKLVLDVNVGGTENIVDMCLEHPECKKMVYVSSTGAIPELPHGQKIKEVEEVNLDELEGWYSKSKAMATNNVYTAIKKRGLKACVVYPTGIFGPNDHAVRNHFDNHQDHQGRDADWNQRFVQPC